MTKQRLSPVTLGVQDVERSAAFYTSIGFDRRAQDPTIVTLESQGLVLVLKPWEQLADELGVAPQGSGFRGLLLTFLCSHEGEVDAAYERWVGAGGVGVRQPADRELGGRAAIVADPDAHLWELAAGLPVSEGSAGGDEVSDPAHPDPEPRPTPA